jgi:hypothetical protein
MDRPLSQGISGPDVRTAQAYLNLHLESPGLKRLKEDGIFGPATRARAVEFQRDANLKPDGIIGPKTRAALLAFEKSTVQGTLTPKSSTSAVPSVQLPPSLRELPDVHEKEAKPYLQVPDWLTPKPRDHGFQLKKWEFQGGNEFDLPWSDSSPAQISVEATFLRRSDGTNQEGTLGAQWSWTPQSADGKWNGQFYLKKSWEDVIPNVGPVSFLNPWIMAYAKIPSNSPSVLGLGVGNESSVDLIKNDQKKTVLSFVFGPGLTVNLIDLDGPKLIGKPNGQFTFGLKVTIEPTPTWTSAVPGHSPP